MESRSFLSLFILTACLAANVLAVPMFIGPLTRTVYLAEESPFGTVLPLTVTAFDSTGGTFTFSTSSTHFAITDSNPGVITVRSPADRETTPNSAIQFSINLSDSGGMTTQLLNVTVVLTDINDNAPVWTNKPQAPVSIREDSDINNFVFLFAVTDADIGNNGNFRFRITSPVDGTFTVDTLTGAVRVGRPLDFDTTDSYSVRVTAEDTGNPSRSDTFTLIVNIIDVLNSAPVFTQSVYNVEIEEGDYSTTAQVLTRVIATGSTRSDITLMYMKQSTGVPGFNVDAESGSVSFMGTLDREGIVTYFITVSSVEVRVSNTTAAISEPALTTVIVTVTDANDNTPTFFTNHYQGMVSESSPVGHVVIQGINAFDIDQGTNNVFSFAVMDPSSVPFTIDPTTGVISVNEALDYETTTSYTFTILARETATVERREGTANVIINVENVNDNFPTFAANTYMFEVEEGASAASLTSVMPAGVTMITATDTDGGVFGQVTYSLNGFGADRFLISATGVLSTEGALDREDTNSREMFYLTLIAEDGAGTLTNPNRGTTFLVITVLDINDNAPIFNPNTYTLFLVEETDYPNLLTLIATDADKPLTVNSDISYSITNQDGTDVSANFLIGSNSGVVSALNLDCETTSSFSLLVTATDSGTNPGPLSGTATISVTIQCINEFGPIFDPPTYMATIDEDHAPSSAIGITVSATDIEGHGIIYSLSPDAIFFSIDETSGVLSLAHSIDVDAPGVSSPYSFMVIARDDAANPLSGFAMVTVTVNNVNDNTPIITNPPGRDPTMFSIVEGAGTLLPNQLLTVEATDLDGDTVTYAVTSGAAFMIDSTSGLLQQMLSLDRESSPTETVAISACDPGGLCDTVSLMITVTDFNDNRPVFDPSNYAATISECDAVEHVPVVVVLAVDSVDLGANAEVEYMFISGDTPRFTIDSTTGRVRLAGTTWDFESGMTSFTVTVGATDNPSGSPQLSAATNAVVTLTLTDCNDNPPVFDRDEYTFTITEGSTVTDNPVFSDIIVNDSDITPALQLRTFEIIGGVASANNWLDIDSSTGVINILAGQTIDRESSFLRTNAMGERQLTFDVLVTNMAASATFTATATVTVLIADINDNDPIIDQADPIAVSVVEHALQNSIITIITATDLDSGDNAHIAFSIIAGDSANNFAIGPENGHLTVLGDLDREGVNMFTLTVQAENDMATGGTPDTVTVNVEVIGTNDFNPVFDRPQYDTSLIEYDSLLMMNGVSPNVTVQTVHATDGDGTDTPAGQIEYRIASGNIVGGEMIFDIPIPIQGAITIVRPDLIDYETQSQFDLVVVAYDLVSPAIQRRQGTTHVIVNIQDVNDNVPMFSDAVYAGTILEEQTIGATVLVAPTIRATDADMDGMDPLTYSLVSGQPFSISSDGMVVSTTARIDREADLSFPVMVVVQDSSGHLSSSQLMITVLDVNDNAPRFLKTPSQLEIHIPENLAVFPHVDSLVQRVEAVDDDIDNNAQITYLLSGHRGNFDITMSTGQVRLIASLDRDLIASLYPLNVTATDGSLSSWIVFDVIIDNVNDNNPVFLQPVWEGVIAEDVLIGAMVSVLDLSTDLQVMAEDLDPASNVTYFLSPTTSTPPPPFDVTANGYIVTTGLLDREMQERFSFSVRATDGFRVSLEDTLIEVTVSDVNDQAPVFDQPSYTADVFEFTPENAIFLILRADDADSGTNAEIEYSITGTSPVQSTGLFQIDMTSGAISPTRDVILSVGDPTTITLTVTATDKGPFALDMSVPVEFNLLDRNPNAPNFTEILYSFTVVENLIGGLVGMPRAIDPSAFDTVITYAILDNSDGHENFYIDNTTGDIFTALQLDRESRDIFTLTISAADSATTPRTGFATVSIRVNDENDNSPYFVPDVYPIAISESTSINATVIRVFAFDDDTGSNAEISYRIVMGDRSIFSVDNTGVISTQMELDREIESNYLLVIEARDNGSPPNMAFANVSILINDVNDNSPTFTDGAVLSSDPVTVNEDAESGFLLTTIQAEDPDFQLNGIVNYYFQNLTISRGPFQIDRETGRITLRPDPDGELDREKIDTYELTVIAADLRGLGQTVRTTTGTFLIRVLDINDNIPTFISPLYEFEIPEAFSLNTPFGQVQADDADIGTNAELYYHMLGESTVNTTCSNEFCVDLETGELTLTKTLDRETNSFHLLTVAVSNNMVLAFNDTTGAPIAASTGSISITVTDTNDQAPAFVPGSLFAAVAEEAPFGTTITTLEAIDEDTLNGSIVWFEITTPQVPYLVDRDTGAVTTAGVFTGLSGTINEITVRAFDNFGQIPTFSTPGKLIVQVFKLSEQVILTFGRDKEVIEAKQDQLHSALVELTQARIIITDIRVQQTSAGEVVITGTDVIFFALDPVNGNVLNPALVLRIIDEQGTIQAIFRECNLISVMIHPPDDPTGTAVPIWVWVVLGILALAVVCMCCCFLIGCVVERRRSRRWKKKAATTQNHSQMEQFSAMTDYNTMANPLWVSPYGDYDQESTTVSSVSTKDRSNPLYESQELTIEMFQDDGEDDKVGSRENLIKAPPLSIPAPVHRSDGMYDSQEIEIQMFDDLDEPDSERESDVQLLRTSTPHGLAGKKGRGKKASRDDRLLAAAIGDTSDDDSRTFI